MRVRALRSVGILLVAALFFPANCKKGIVTPENLPVIWTNLNSITFAAAELGPNPAEKILIIKNGGAADLILFHK